MNDYDLFLLNLGGSLALVEQTLGALKAAHDALLRDDPNSGLHAAISAAYVITEGSQQSIKKVIALTGYPMALKPLPLEGQL